MKYSEELNGAWEERGVIGTRIEIDAPKIVVLWRNSPVLTTTFKEKPRDGGVELSLKRSGLRYENSHSDYAELRELFFKDGKLEMTEYFPITGESKQTLSKTENSRYGNFTIADEVLNELQGEWSDEKGLFTLEFSKNTLLVHGVKRKIHILRSNSTPSYPLRIVDEDPSVYEFEGYSSLEYDGGVIIGRPMIFDAPPIQIIFRKK